jgi:hypothetical protein
MEICEILEVYRQLFEIMFFPLSFIVPDELWVIIKELLLNC